MAYARNIRSVAVAGDEGIVPLSRGLAARIDAADVWLVCDRNWHAQVKSRQTYAASSPLTGEKSMLMLHRVIVGATEGQVVDHIDGDGLNNHRANLRICSHKENVRFAGLSRRNKTGFKGVSARGDRFVASIFIDGVSYHLGMHDTAEEAHAAYVAATKRAFGAFARSE